MEGGDAVVADQPRLDGVGGVLDLEQAGGERGVTGRVAAFDDHRAPSAGEDVWAGAGSNRRPLAFQASARTD